ncbi:signal peptidase II [Bifidobacterium sp. ESL0790]|uniref:signal peptidase II n=1 Tax=Bifidobacterium sp. ESL0790 TaxID=2983233 RepID=UPI0023F823DA|nr:signal peptidase II [Bifidobacterium sp. ESL0790]WEV72836.1 signal peptidase II [Bifidobacterium sp. ESL0790]
MKANDAKRLRVRVAVFLAVALLALLVDRVTKIWAAHALGDGRTIVVIPRLLSLTLVHNPGASLGLGSSVTWLISCVAFVACLVMAYFALTTVSLWWTVGLGLGFAGAMGNLIDRVIYADGFVNGRVVDFLNYGWSVGNVADIILMVAAAIIIVLILAQVPFSRHDVEDGSAPHDADAADNTNISDAANVADDLNAADNSNIAAAESDVHTGGVV